MAGKTNVWFIVYNMNTGMYLKWKHGARKSYTKVKDEAERFKTKTGAMFAAMKLGDEHVVEGADGTRFA